QVLFQLDIKGENVPCDDESIQKSCYHLPTKICKSTWDELEIKCNELLPKVMGRTISPSEIISPKILKCQKLLFDRQFKNSRKMDGGPRCEEHFTYIHERRHDFD
ncbi:MAG TPA: hypothetical protein PLJ21_13405, partial [Pseudobdellovibrionaceae bacterium]|nr:hypothetical protein [Pseudobdellovibrionaceae bacterium]